MKQMQAQTTILALLLLLSTDLIFKMLNKIKCIDILRIMLCDGEDKRESTLHGENAKSKLKAFQMHSLKSLKAMKKQMCS